jgi:hypothetical protein
VVIQECENPATSKNAEYADWAGTGYRWVGRVESKGLGVFPRGSLVLDSMEEGPLSARFFLSFRVEGYPFCAVWAQRDLSGSMDYVGQVWNFLSARPNWLNDPKCVVLGDFNSNRIWDAKRRPWNHSAVVEALNNCGLRSAYHETSGDDQGAEIQPTFFMQRNRSKPYHIDYAFVGKAWAVRSVVIGTPDDWLSYSDHLPVLVELWDSP